MIESAARAERLEPQASASPVFLWEVALKPVAVRIPFVIIDKLEQEAVESFRSLSSRGSEIGGLLMGSIAPGNPSLVFVENYELITCDYSRGPLYRLSEADTDRFDRAMAQHVARGTAVVGYFRSHTRKGLSLDAEEIGFLDARFSNPSQIALVVRPFATKASSGAIFIRENGVFNGEATLKEFPFRSSLLTAAPPAAPPSRVEQPPTAPPPPSVAAPTPAAPKTTARAHIVPIAPRREMQSPIPPLAAEPEVAEPPAPAAPPEPARPAREAAAPPPGKKEEPRKEEAPAKVEPPAPKPEPKAEAPAPAPVAEPSVEPEAKSGGALKFIVAAAAAVVVIVALFVYPGFLMHHSAAPAPTAQDNSALNLRVQRNGGEVLLTWNRDSDVIRSATKGVLSISDGEQHENVDMDVATLKTGSITYNPATADVMFKLEVTGKGDQKTASESIRALQARPSPMPAVGQTGSTQANSTTPAKPANGTQPNAAPDATAQTPATEEAKPAEKAPVRTFRAESLSQRLRPTNAADLPDAPALGSAPATATPTPALSLNPGLPLPPPAPTKQAAAPAPAPAVAPVRSAVVQAELIRRKDPDYPKIARDAGAKGEVRLEATIGTDGHVKSVKVLSGHPMLRKAAADAVMQWLYKPTVLNGTPIEGTTIVQVNFVGR